MRSTKGWEEGWLLLFFCISHDALLQFLEDGPKEEDVLCITPVMKGIIVKLITYVMQYILNENHMGNFLF